MFEVPNGVGIKRIRFTLTDGTYGTDTWTVYGPALSWSGSLRPVGCREES